MKKKIKLLFVIITMKPGGIQSALVNLCRELVALDKYDIDIMIFDKEGVMLKELPRKCHIYYASKITRLISMSQKKLFHEEPLWGILRFLLGGIAKLFGSSFSYHVMLLFNKKMKGYDMAISYEHYIPHSLFGGCNEFVLWKTQAKRKVAFIHGDYIKCGLNNKYSKKIYSKFDAIAHVSESCKNLFDSCVPELKKKSFVVKNCCDYKTVIKKAEEQTKEYNNQYFNIVTVARIAKAKALDRCVEIFKRLVDQEIKIRWYIVGGGADEDERILQDKIKKYHLQEVIFLMGEQSNPYKYMSKADLFFLPSEQEAAPVVFQEAVALQLPILTTETLSAKEMVANKGYGIVCHNSKKGIYDALRDIILKKSIIDNIKEKANYRNVDNNEAIRQFEKLIEDEVEK